MLPARGRHRTEAGDVRSVSCRPAGRCQGAPERASEHGNAGTERGCGGAARSPRGAGARRGSWPRARALLGRVGAAGAGRGERVTSEEGARRAAAGGAVRLALRAAAGGALGREGRSSAREETGEERPPGPRAAAEEGAAEPEPERERNS